MTTQKIFENTKNTTAPLWKTPKEQETQDPLRKFINSKLYPERKISQGEIIKKTVEDAVSKTSKSYTRGIFDGIDDYTVEKNIPLAQKTISDNIEAGRLSLEDVSKMPNLEPGLTMFFAASEINNMSAANKAYNAAYKKVLPEKETFTEKIKTEAPKKEEQEKPEKEKNIFRKGLDITSDALTYASLIPGIDTFADLLAVPVDLARGDYVSALLDLAGVVPYVGEFADAAKVARTLDNTVDGIKAANKAIDTAKVADKATDAAKSVNKARDYAKVTDKTLEYEKLSKQATEMAKRSPIAIPDNVKPKVQIKDKYSQVQYIWEAENYEYVSRWHTPTPNAPKQIGNSWVVSRTAPKSRASRRERERLTEILVGKDKWVSNAEWSGAIKARNSGTITKEQKELLKNGHWKD